MTRASTNFIGSENQGFADVIVNYGGGAAGDVTVDFTTADGTALAGTNYTTVTRTITFTNGQTVAIVSIPLQDDAFQNPNRTVLLSLSNPTGGALLGSISNSVLTIQDNEAPVIVSAAGTFNFSSAGYTVHEFETVRSGLGPVGPSPVNLSVGQSAQGALITVTRTGGSSGKVMVDAVVTGVGDVDVSPGVHGHPGGLGQHAGATDLAEIAARGGEPDDPVVATTAERATSKP